MLPEVAQRRGPTTSHISPNIGVTAAVAAAAFVFRYARSSSAKEGGLKHVRDDRRGSNQFIHVTETEREILYSPLDGSVHAQGSGSPRRFQKGRC